MRERETVNGSPQRRRGSWAAALGFVACCVAACDGGDRDGGRRESPEDAAGPGPAHERRLDEFLLGGIQINEPDMGVWHASLLDAGFNTVALTVYARQGRWDSADIEFDPDGLGGDLRREMRTARRAGLRVVLILRVALDHAVEENRFLWHGLIHPLGEEDLHLWFQRYGEFVRSWAAVAEEEGVDLLGIGSELSALTSTVALDGLPPLEAWYLDREKQQTERERILSVASGVDREHLRAGWNQTAADLPEFLDRRTAAQAEWARQVVFDGDLERLARRRTRLEEHWRELVDEVRGVFSGSLTYAANFDQFRQVGFWDALDVIGINAYFPLREELGDGPVASLEPLFRAAWSGILDDVDAFRSQVAPGTPVVFTELGYTPRLGSTIQPWAGRGFAVVDEADGEAPEPKLVVWEDQPLEPLERALAVRALADAVRQRPDLLGGLLYWKLSTVPEHRQIEPFVMILSPERDPLHAALLSLREAAVGRRP